MTVDTDNEMASKTDEALKELDDEVVTPDDDDEDDDDKVFEEAESTTKVSFSQRETGSASVEDTGETIKKNDAIQDSIRQSIENSLRKVEGKVVAGFVVLSRPVQRQRWGDTQLHPHVEWGSLFFDLFFVAMAYNLANIVRQDPSTHALLYFVGCFLPVTVIWFDKLIYDARFFTRDDVLHRFFEVLVLVTLGAAVLNIRPVDILSTPSDNPEIFAFCFTVLLGNVWTVLRYVEVLIWVEGEPAAKRSALRDISFKILPLSLYLAATVYSGLEFFQARNGGGGAAYNDGYRWLAEAASNSTYDCSDEAHRRFLAGEESSDVDPCACVDGDEAHRWLAAATDCEKYSSSGYGASSDGYYETDSTDIPIILMLAGTCSTYALTLLWMVVLPGGGNHKQYTVPMNVDFTIHRYGEWTMLMLGESILSLLIVEVSRSQDYYVTFYAGILSVVLLQYMHFRSQPHSADEHAMRKSKERGVAYAYLMVCYSAALVLLGATYKMLLYEFVYAADDSHRRSLLFEHIPRWLAGADGALKYDLPDRRQRIAHFFSGSMAVVFFCSDSLILTHRDFKTNIGRCRCEKTKKTKLLGIFLILVRAGVIAFVATLSQYQTNPKVLSFTGLAAIFFQVLLRFASAVVFPSDQIHVELEEKKEEMDAKQRAEREEKERRDQYRSGDIVENQ